MKKWMKCINVSWLIFGVIICLHLAILVPVFFQRAPHYNLLSQKLNLPYTLKVTGRIFSNSGNGDFLGYILYAGGYKTDIREDGTFELKLLSGSKEDIMLVVIDRHGSICAYRNVAFCENVKRMAICIEVNFDEL